MSDRNWDYLDPEDAKDELTRRERREEGGVRAGGVTLTIEECRELHALIDELSGGSPESAFAWDGTDSLHSPRVAALAKVYLAAGEPVPDGLREGLEP